MPSIQAWQIVVILACAALPALNSIDVSLEHDTWWHLAIGQAIVDAGAVPEVDPLSRMSQEHPTPWRAYSWLYEVVVFGIFEQCGVCGLLVFRTLLVGMSTITVLAFLLRRGGKSPLAMLAGVLVMTTLMMLTRERPWHFTITFTTLTLWAVQAVRDGLPLRKVLWLLPMFALWANLHIQFVLGWGLLGLACLFPGRASRAGLFALTAGCIMATAFNPYHVQLLEVMWEYATQAAPLRLVQELAPPDWLANSTIATAMLLGLGLLISLKRRPVDGFELVLLIVAAILAARMRRDIWFAGLAGIAMLRSTPVPDGKIIAKVMAMIAVMMLALRAGELVYRGRWFDYAAAQQSRFPVRAVEAIQRAGQPGPIFNEFDWGGYLSWNLPTHPVSVDGRTNLYGSQRIRQSFETWATPDGWQRDPVFLASRIVLAPKDRVLTEVLRADASWAILHEDDTAVVFVRR